MVERRALEREVGVRSSLRSLCCILEQDTFTSQKVQLRVLVIPRKRWLRPDMTEKLLTGTQSLNPNKRKTSLYWSLSSIIRIYHEFVDRINNFVPRVTVCQVMPNSDQRDRFVYPFLKIKCRILFLEYFWVSVLEYISYYLKILCNYGRHHEETLL